MSSVVTSATVGGGCRSRYVEDAALRRPGQESGQVQTITQAGDGAKVTTEINMGNGTTMSMSYTTARWREVPVYSAGKVAA
jgi:hypothetical protein